VVALESTLRTVEKNQKGSCSGEISGEDYRDWGWIVGRLQIILIWAEGSQHRVAFHLKSGNPCYAFVLMLLLP
jgi:hypothetical protein